MFGRPSHACFSSAIEKSVHPAVVGDTHMKPSSKTSNYHGCSITRVSASRKTHFSYCVKRQQCSLVKVTPSSGRCSSRRFVASPESRTFTSTTASKTERSWSLKFRTDAACLNCYLVTIIAISIGRFFKKGCGSLFLVNVSKLCRK